MTKQLLRQMSDHIEEMNKQATRIRRLTIFIAICAGMVFLSANCALNMKDKQIDNLKSDISMYQTSVTGLESALEQKQAALDDVIDDLNQCLEDIYAQEHR